MAVEHDSGGVEWEDEGVYHDVRVVAGTMRRIFKFDNSKHALIIDDNIRVLTTDNERREFNTKEGIYY